MKKITSILFFIFFAAAAFAQKDDRPLIQFSGLVHNADSTRVIVPYVSIVNLSNKGLVSVSRYNGYFSFVVHEHDTLRFSSVGYASTIVVVPESVPSRSYILQVLLKPQIINLPVFHVFPWATTEEFTKEFLSMKLADDDLSIAEKNLSRSSIEALRRSLPRDGYETYSFQDFHNDQLNSHSTVNPLLNPFNWGSLIKQISDGDKARAADAAPASPSVSSN
jgi:hypothetical protein